MKAREHTRSMLRWWWQAGILLADLAIRRGDRTIAWRRGVSLLKLPLAWARAENVRQAEIYIRPARGHSWPIVFLDDLSVETATNVARKYDSLVVHTSLEGGCHLWLHCHDALDENERCRAQQWLAQRVKADPGSLSGEHLGRIAGFKNWKRSGAWVNVLHARRRNKPWSAQLVDSSRHRKRLPSSGYPSTTGRTDMSASGREWGWICGLLENGCDPTTAHAELVKRARSRRGPDAERYARHTIENALAHVGLSATTREPRDRGLTSMPS